MPLCMQIASFLTGARMAKATIRAARLVKLVATCGPLDIDDPQPAITVMMPDED